MPRQARGFWTCDFCQATFHTPNEASIHELHECPRRRAQHEGLYAETANLSHRTYRTPQMFPTAGYRRYLVMGHSSGRLTNDDATTCQNIELFEVDNTNTTDAEGAALAAGTVGLRCIHCIGDPTAGGGNAAFPRCVSDIGDCLRDIAEGHLWRCQQAPPQVRQILEDALATRRQARQEGGQAWFQQENARRLLLEYCAFMAQDLGLMNMFPMNSGVSFPPVEMYPVASQHHQHGYYAEGIGAAQHQRTQQSMSSQTASGTAPVRSLGETFEFDPIPDTSLPFGSSMQKDDESERQSEAYAFAPQFYPETASGSAALPARPGQEAPAPYDNMPVNFPFVYEPTSGTWVCKFCQHVPLHFRDQHFQWSTPGGHPPPADYIEQHLNICQMHRQSLMQAFHDPPQSIPQPFHHQPQQAFQSFAGDDETFEAQESKEDTPMNRAMSYLDAHNLSENFADGTPVPENIKLILDDDRLLLTDYYHYIMKQLRPCRFVESDRRTRGGKRDAVEIGFGGLQCVHCANHPNARKFFWSSVDKLANSFAEIPNHILKCKGCPKATQDALLTLKEKHHGQMAKVPRGSQKVYFRRVWRRIHQPDTLQTQRSPTYHPFPTNSTPVASRMGQPERLHPFTTQRLSRAMPSSPGDNSDNFVFMERDPSDAARTLQYSAMQPGPPSPSSRVLLAIPDDKQWLSDIDIFIRQQVEVFCATADDVEESKQGSKPTIEEGTVGLRCIHCAIAKQQVTEHHTLYPFSIGGIYEAVQEFHRLHLDHCQNISPAAASKLSSLKSLKRNSSLPSVGRNYYIQAAHSLGLVDTKNGIRASGSSVPIPATFSFSEHSRSSSIDMSSSAQQGTYTPRKRQRESSHTFEERQPETPMPTPFVSSSNEITAESFPFASYSSATFGGQPQKKTGPKRPGKEPGDKK